MLRRWARYQLAIIVSSVLKTHSSPPPGHYVALGFLPIAGTPPAPSPEYSHFPGVITRAVSLPVINGLTTIAHGIKEPSHA